MRWWPILIGGRFKRPRLVPGQGRTLIGELASARAIFLRWTSPPGTRLTIISRRNCWRRVSEASLAIRLAKHKVSDGEKSGPHAGEPGDPAAITGFDSKGLPARALPFPYPFTREIQNRSSQAFDDSCAA